MKFIQTDQNECRDSPCGENAICTDTVGSFTCTCLPDYSGDPFKGCADINECDVLEHPCGDSAICENAVPGYNCKCPQGFQGKPDSKVACEQVDVNILCQSNFDCTNNAECIENQCFCLDGFEPIGSNCIDVDECRTHEDLCGVHSVCINTPGSFMCSCENGYVGEPPRSACKEPCADVKCGDHAFCKADAAEAYCICDEGWSFNPNNISAGCVDINECESLSGKCGLNAICENSPGSFTCKCPSGYSGEPQTKCEIEDLCSKNKCGVGAICENTSTGYNCICPDGSIPDPNPFIQCSSILKCADNKDCPGNSICNENKQCLCPHPNIGNDCRHPCESLSCGINSECVLINGRSQCQCLEGFNGKNGEDCVDVDECASKPCSQSALCVNIPGKYECQCPNGYIGDAYENGCSKTAQDVSCANDTPCPNGEECKIDSFTKQSVCICQQGYERNSAGKCEDINECLSDKFTCGFNGICKNLPGSYQCHCPEGFVGNPFESCEECNTPECKCKSPYKLVGNSCMLAGCRDKKECPKGATCITISDNVSYCACSKGYKSTSNGECEDINECLDNNFCSYGAECINNPGNYTCVCSEGTKGDPYNGLCAPAQQQCSADSDCKFNEKCVEPGECICPPPYFTDSNDNKCKSPCERFSCGINAKCTPSDPPQCMCEVGFKGDPLMGCIDEDECSTNPCAYGAYCLNKKGGYECLCPKGMTGDPYKSGCILESGAVKSQCAHNDDCSSNLACSNGKCVSPCSSLLCGENAFCETENHAAWCRCKVGFIEGVNGGCVSQCKDLICGKGAMCIPTSEGPTCKCQPKYRGNPFAGGVCKLDECTSINQCSFPQVCINGRCKERCDEVVCGISASCEKFTGKCVCDFNFVGDPNLLCMPPISIPSCSPDCGVNAHCQYKNNKNVCVCNEGTTGNPYDGCGAQKKTTCEPNTCGSNAECRSDLSGISCFCSPGFTGNPYLSCSDVNECDNNPCGTNAVCLNNFGSFDCVCMQNFGGNPFKFCQKVESRYCDEARACHCTENNLCPIGYECKNNRCEDLCSNIKCGPKSVCDAGQCICPVGYSGDPTDLIQGCSIEGGCNNNDDCANTDICFQQTRNIRKCIDACAKMQCGPNTVCVSSNHRSVCLCKTNYNGNPNDINVGCQPETRNLNPNKCNKDSDCPSEQTCLTSSLSDSKSCVHLCSTVVCGINEKCSLDHNNTPVCNCNVNYVWNPETSSCEKPSVAQCKSNSDCDETKVCSPDSVGVLKCTNACLKFTCSENAQCSVQNHIAQCECLEGFAGNPNDRIGCTKTLKNTCRSNAECPESEACVLNEKTQILNCRPSCENVKCGPNAVCVTNNHVAKCQCQVGLYLGNPYDLEVGCKSVACMYNIDCPISQLCNRLTHSCENVCSESTCGENAVCLADEHRSLCQCPPGYKANPLPEVECIPMTGCTSGFCHNSAVCEMTSGGPICKCPDNFKGDPYKEGCSINESCKQDSDCPENYDCKSGRCKHLCDTYCGKNTECSIIDGKPICACAFKFSPNQNITEDGCSRTVSKCTSETDCGGHLCHNGQCRIACRNYHDCANDEKCISNICVMSCLDHAQCQNGMACVNGVCSIGCRSDDSCLPDQSCVNNKCVNACLTGGVCGPNAGCNTQKHKTYCSCPEGFEGNPIPEQGCIRVPRPCKFDNQCTENYKCNEGYCNFPCTKNLHCAIGERCYEEKCLKVCYTSNNCLPGEICNNDGVCKPGCESDSDCPQTELCMKGKCQCAKGFIGTPFGCTDINECSENPCHESSKCENTPGSFKCVCPEGMITDGLSGVCQRTAECSKHGDCLNKLSCIQGKCISACDLAKCGHQADCIISNNEAVCVCPESYLGDSYDEAIGCFKVECTNDEQCGTDKMCDSNTNRCVNPCDVHNCGKGGACNVRDHQIDCSCHPGYALQNSTCVDVDECDSKPCSENSMCINLSGSYKCDCVSPFIKNTKTNECKLPNECVSNEDCSENSFCSNSKCENPCNTQKCGKNANCKIKNHEAECECPEYSKGDPESECVLFECKNNEDCGSDYNCHNNFCIDPCSLPNVCGVQSTCSIRNQVVECKCLPGTTGNPVLGCISLQYCNNDAQCLSGTICDNGICSGICSSNRECINEQLCINNVCKTTCRNNETCPEFQFCHNNICLKENRCVSDGDCNDSEICQTDKYGRSTCTDVCFDKAVCGRNSECLSRNHAVTCKCKENFFGDPKTSCRKIECLSNSDCSSDKMCDHNVCKIACLVDDACGENAICTAENHDKVCQCQPGYTGNPQVQCQLIDFCKDSPCGPGAKCRNQRGNFKCVCPLNLVGDPYNEGCHPASECEKNEDCPTHTKCTMLNEVGKCNQICDNNVKCGPNANCATEGFSAVCQCNVGFEGDPNDTLKGCRVNSTSCQKSSDCPYNTYCSNNKCTSKF